MARPRGPAASAAAGDASRGLSVAEDGETGLVCDWWEGVFGDSALCNYCGFENSAIKKLAQS